MGNIHLTFINHIMNKSDCNVNNTSPSVSIIVVNYNGLEHVEECLGSLLSQTYANYEILVVDNGSSDGSSEVVRTEFPDIKIIDCGENKGYSGAVNYAIDFATGDYIAVLNMDIAVEPDWLTPLVDFLSNHPNVGAVTPKIVLYNQRDQLNALGQNVHITGLGFNRRLHYPVSSAETQAVQVSGLHGSAFLIRKSLLSQIGGMNEANFMYHEDVDISWMILLSDYDIYCVPQSVIYHKYRLFMNAWKYYYLERNRWALLLSTLRIPTVILLSPLFLFTELMMFVYCLRRGREFVSAKWRAIVWNVQNWGNIRERRRHVQALRRRSEFKFITSLRLNYDWDQLLHLAVKR